MTSTTFNNLAKARAAADKHAEHLGVFVRPLYDQVRAEPSGLLAPLTLGVKDVVFESSGPATAQSNVSLAKWPEGQPEGQALKRLKAAGASVVGKTATMEYALGVQDGTGPGPISRNPWALDHWAGGSSSGSGSGVVAGCFDAALATDTTGSLRIPAAYTGATGIKPTSGLVPTDGIYPLAPSLDTLGPIARSVETCARVLQVMVTDSSSETGPADLIGALGQEVGGLRIGVDRLTEHADAGVDPAQPDVFDKALQTLRQLGTAVETTSVPNYAILNVVGNIIMLAEAHEIHRDTLESRWSEYGRGARWVFSAAQSLAAHQYLRAQRLRTTLTRAVDRIFETCDLLVTPTCHLGAPRLDDMHPLDPSTYLGSMHTTAWSVTGHPVAVVPIGFTEAGLPLSMSIVGPHWAEPLIIGVADAFQQATGHHEKRPSGM
ncbi:amidase [Flexivirga sp. ID2601S]|uniref:Amidase n=1 Tax=Flexivirga aerilata TaxID=1656889 RepID=A0A849AFL9_9MICO|nr:amidase [Flexivirga aerilata]NNG38376.1 amidase [Flexivirga aerilata]